MLKMSDGIPRWPMTQKKNQSCDALVELFLRAELGSLNVHHRSKQTSPTLPELRLQ